MTPQKISIDLSCPFQIQPGAKFIASLAYPKSADRALRDRYSRALCRWQVIKLALRDFGYANNHQLITPTIFVDDDAIFWRALRTGLHKFGESIVATICIVIPYLAKLKVDSEDPGVNKLGTLAAQALGRKNLSTFKSDVWSSTRLVAHAEAAYLFWEFLRSSKTTDFVEECLQNPRVVAQVIRTSEEIRLRLPTIKEMK